MQTQKARPFRKKTFCILTNELSYQVQASAETIAERVDRFANQMRQLERQAINIINVRKF